jgi:hypothetical protein
MDRVTQSLWRGVEGPLRSYPVDAVRSFLATQAREQGSPCGTHLMVTWRVRGVGFGG